jgi:hypothetical protein
MEMLGRSGKMEGAESILEAVEAHLNRLNLAIAERSSFEGSET